MPSDIEDLVSQWFANAARWQQAHYESAKRYRKLHVLLGSASVALSAVAGTAVFANLGEHGSPGAQAIAGSVVLIVAVLAALQTFLHFEQLAERHRSTGAAYGAIRRDIDLHLHRGDLAEPWIDETLRRLDRLSEAAPEIPPRLWRRLEPPHGLHVQRLSPPPRPGSEESSRTPERPSS